MKPVVMRMSHSTKSTATTAPAPIPACTSTPSGSRSLATPITAKKKNPTATSGASPAATPPWRRVRGPRAMTTAITAPTAQGLLTAPQARNSVPSIAAPPSSAAGRLCFRGTNTAPSITNRAMSAAGSTLPITSSWYSKPSREPRSKWASMKRAASGGL